MGDKAFLELSDIEFDNFINSQRSGLFAELEAIDSADNSGIMKIKYKLDAINSFADYRKQLKIDVKLRSEE